MIVQQVIWSTLLSNQTVQQPKLHEHKQSCPVRLDKAAPKHGGPQPKIPS
jgi:hypothetical protein